MRDLVASFGGKHNARVQKTWRGSFAEFVRILLSKVPETADKASNGWVCGASFNPEYRDSENFKARHLLSFDYDHITQNDLRGIREAFGGYAHLAYSTFSHTAERPRYRIWFPLSRHVGYDEFQAVSRAWCAKAGIELAARESHVPAQYMYKPAVKPFDEIQVWKNLEGPWINVDEVLATYENWTDRTTWPHRAEGDGVHTEGSAQDPRTKPGLVGAFCRAYSISDAIARFELPYKPGSSEGRLTYTDGSRPDGAIIYDDDAKLHSHHDTDPSRGQNNSFDLVRLHSFGWLDSGATGVLGELPSSKAMAAMCAGLPEIRKQLVADEGFKDLDATDLDWLRDSAAPDIHKKSTEGPSAAIALPARIPRPTSKLTDQENARRIQARHREKLICVGKTFYHWIGTNWEYRQDRSTHIIARLSEIVGDEAKAHEEKLTAKATEAGRVLDKIEEEDIRRYHAWSAACAQRTKLDACESILRKALAFDAEYLNRDPNLFTCLNGTIDLRTGLIRPAAPLDFITACAPVAYDVNAEAPRFKAFLAAIFNGDLELVAFMKRWFGYCLTGSVAEHAVVFHVGGGGNGKGAIMRLMAAVLGPGYYTTGGDALLNSKPNGGATPDKADLLGRRMVTISETKEGMELPLEQIKALTGGDPIKARHLHKDLIEFNPTHKLQIFTNHAPVIRDMDESMWRRVISVSYPNKYGTPDAVKEGRAHFVKDLSLEPAMLLEKQGVLRWLIEGAREWHEQGLNPPPSVLQSTKAYRQEQDLIGTFASDRLIVDPSAWTALTGAPQSVLQAYRGWCDEMGYRPLGRLRFSKELERVMPAAVKGPRAGGEPSVTGYLGFRLTSESFDD